MRLPFSLAHQQIPTYRVRLTGKKREQWDCHEASVMTTSPNKKTQANQLVCCFRGLCV